MAVIITENLGRSGGIRTHDPYTPSIVRYQAALHSDIEPLYTTAKHGCKQNSVKIIHAKTVIDQAYPILSLLSCRLLPATPLPCEDGLLLPIVVLPIRDSPPHSLGKI